MDARIYKPKVVWETFFREVVLIDEETINTPATYRLKVVPININDLGADTAQKEVGFFIQDYIGRYYRIIEINVGGNNQVIKVSDDFRFGQCPQSGQIGVVFKSIQDGIAPYLSPKYSRHLSRSAIDENIGIDHAILWRTNEKFEFTNTSTPTINSYQSTYADIIGQNPKFSLRSYYESGKEWVRQEVPVLIYVGGKLDSITWDLSEACSGYIYIYR